MTVRREGVISPLFDGMIPEAYGSIAITASAAGVKNPIVVVEKTWEILRTLPDFDDDQPIKQKGFNITSHPNEVFVYVGSFSSATADGYMVLPTIFLGTEYMHMSEFDNDEAGPGTPELPNPASHYETR